MLAVRLRRGMQPASILASSGGLVSAMPISTSSAPGDNFMEMNSQGTGAAVFETRPPCRMNFGRVGWGQVLSQSSCPGTLCYATAADGAAASGRASSLAPVLSPSADEPARWDSACVANPVVLAPGPGEDRWKLFYYGNNGTWSDGTVGFLPTGTSGLAESP